MSVLSDFSEAWDNLYHNHLSKYVTGSVTIVENEKHAKNKSFTIRCTEAVSFPSKQFDAYDMFGALEHKNCDGALLINNEEGSCDLVFVEMKSQFSSREVYGAKLQITNSWAKIQSLFQMMKLFQKLPIRKVLGLIEYRKLDIDQENYWSKCSLLPDEKLDFGWLLFKYGVYNSATLYPPELNLPSEMTFKIIMSDNPEYEVDYSDIGLSISMVPHATND